MPDRSPFPGMDPWLGSHWEPIHHRFITDAVDQIGPQLPPDLFVDAEVTVYAVGPGGPAGWVRPDVSVFDRPLARAPAGATAGGVGPPVAVARPVLVPTGREPLEQGHVAIRSVASGHPLVTAIEVFSPTDKLRRAGRQTYRRKRRGYHAAGANVVEVDLLRAGPWLVDVAADRLTPADRRTAYRAAVHRAASVEAVEFYPLPLRQRLSPIRVPLRPNDPDVALDLQVPIWTGYERGRFHLRIDYAVPPDPPLSADDAAWAAGRVAAAGAV